MTTIVKRIEVSCPPSVVYDLLARVERLPEFSDMTVAVRGAPGRPLQVGDRFEQVVKVLGIEIESDWEVVDTAVDRSIRVEGRSATNASATLSHSLSTHGEGTSVEMTVEYDLPLGILGDVIDKLVVERTNEREAERILHRLKELCESSSPR